MKPDPLIKQLMLAYPSLFPNRFLAMSEILTGTSYEWTEDGSIVATSPLKKATRKSMVAVYEERLREAIGEEISSKKGTALNRLFQGRVVDAEANLLLAKHRAANIDQYASDFVQAKDSVLPWIVSVEQRIPSEYWLVNCPPPNIDQQWMEAIRLWFLLILPVMNMNFGIDNGKEWLPRKGREKTFIWSKSMYQFYEGLYREKLSNKESVLHDSEST